MEARSGTRSFEQLTGLLKNRTSAKSAGVKKAAGEDVVPEKDVNDKGGVAIPKDPNTTPAAQLLPPQPTNSDVTPTTAAPAVATTIKGEEKPAKVVDRAHAIVGAITEFRKNSGLKKADGTAEDITPTLPKANNENADKVGDKLPATDKTKTPKNPDANVKAGGAGDMPETPDPTKKDVKQPAGDSKGELPKAKDNANDTTVGSASKAASEEEITYDPMILSKIASLVLATEDGRALAIREIEKAHGAEMAADIIKSAAVMERMAAEAESLEAAGAAAAQEMWDNATPQERNNIIKLAAVHEQGRSACKTEIEKIAYDNGAAMASQLGDSGMPEAPEGQHPSESGEVSEDDILSALDQLVQSGQITPENAQEIMQLLQQGGGEGGAGAEGGAGGSPDAAAGGAAPGGAGADPAAMMAAAGGGGGGAAPEPTAGPEEQDPEKAARALWKKSASAIDGLVTEILAVKAA